MFFKSIRGRLQIWYGLILVLVLGGFGLTAWHLEQGRQLRRTDEELRARVGILLRALHASAPHDPARRELQRGRPPPPDRPPSERGFPDGQRREEIPPPSEFFLPADVTKFFETGGYYYVAWLRDGRELSRSSNAPVGVPFPPVAGGLNHPVRSRGLWREAYHFTPPGECLLAGRFMAADAAAQRRLAWWLSAVGGAILVLGLAGGWWIATQAIRPIDVISNAAAKIAAGDLSQRISTTDTDNELGRMAQVLNSTFARLETAFAQQARFTADAAHELRTPVTVMLSQTQTALHRERSAAEYRQTVETCHRTAQRMRRLIESLLELARLDAGQEPMKRLRFDLSRTARDCMELVQPLAVERGIALRGELPAVECVGDAERLGQVITNLLSNAIQYNKDKGEVRVTLERKNGTASLTVADTGPGISADDLPHLFERFYRADKVRSSASGRTGLGLAISKAIVEAHGGAIEAVSPPGGGASFIVRLPTGADI